VQEMDAAINDVERKGEPEPVGPIADAGNAQVLAHLVRYHRAQVRDAIVDVYGDVAFGVISVACPAGNDTAIGSVVKSLENVRIGGSSAAGIVGYPSARTSSDEAESDR
jgi:hypothetical protein